VPLSALSMRLRGGSRGLFSLTRNLCVAGRNRILVAPMSLEAQNAAVRATRIRVAAPDACHPG
jgi:hypothetical protein